MSGPALLERLLPAPGAEASEARALLVEHGLPVRGEEWWRYSALDVLLDDPWVPAARPPKVLPDRSELDRLAGEHTGPRLVFVDGTFVAELSDLGDLPDGVSCANEAMAARGWLGVTSRYDGFAALNDVAGHDGAAVRVADGVHVDAPITVLQVSTGAPGQAFASHPRTSIELGTGARAVVIETYLGLTARHLANARTTIAVGDGADLTHHKVLRGRSDASHVAHTRVTVGAGARVRSWSVLAGAEVARNAIDVSLDGRGATVELEGLYLPTGSQRYDTAVTVEHAAADGTSHQRYRGVIDDVARGAFSGRVIVQEGTTGNDASQLNRCLLLRPTAEADSRPWLEIFADDVRCTHGATVGRLDEEALFYLRTRGVPHAEARRMLIAAFVDELLATVEVPSLRSLVDELVAGIAGGDR